MRCPTGSTGDDNICFIEMNGQLFYILRRQGKIHAVVQYPVTPGILDSQPQADPVIQVPFIVQHADARVLSSRLIRDFDRPVCAAVIYHDDFEFLSHTLQRRQHAAHRILDAGLFIEAGHDHREAGPQRMAVG